MVCCPEKKALLKDRPALKHKRLFVWIWDTKEHKYLSDCQNNLVFKKYCLKQKAKREFEPEESFKFPISNYKRRKENNKENNY